MQGNEYEGFEDGNITMISDIRNSEHEDPTVYHLRPTELRSVENKFMVHFVFVLLFRLNSDYVKYYIIWFNMLWFGEKFEFKYYIKE